MNPLSAPPIRDIAARTPAAPVRALAPAAAWDELDGSIEPQHVAADDDRKGGRTALVVFLIGLLVAVTGAVLSVAAVVAVVLIGGVLVWMPASQGVNADFLIVPETLPAQQLPVDEVEADFIIEPETLPAAPVAPTPKRSVPVQPAPAQQGQADEVEADFIIVPETLPASEEPAHDDKDAKIKLQALPVDEAIQRVQGKAGRGEARSSRGQ